jgi:hypothetical protein
MDYCVKYFPFISHSSDDPHPPTPPESALKIDQAKTFSTPTMNPENSNSCLKLDPKLVMPSLPVLADVVCSSTVGLVCTYTHEDIQINRGNLFLERLRFTY